MDKANVLTLGYIPDFVECAEFIEHFLANYPHFSFRFLTDSDTGAGTRVVRIPKLGDFSSAPAPADVYAFWAFVETIRVAREFGADYFILFETDCRFSKSNWDLDMFEEFTRWPHEAVVGGTPVHWHPWARGYKHSMKVIDYAYRYQQASGVSMAMEGAYDGPLSSCFYPNGALAIYQTKLMCDWFREPLRFTPGSDEDKIKLATRYHAFDVFIGRCMIGAFGDFVFERMAYLTCSYSGCRNHHLTLADRKVLIETKTKVAVHHLKPEELQR